MFWNKLKTLFWFDLSDLYSANGYHLDWICDLHLILSSTVLLLQIILPTILPSLQHSYISKAHLMCLCFSYCLMMQPILHWEPTIIS